MARFGRHRVPGFNITDGENEMHTFRDDKMRTRLLAIGGLFLAIVLAFFVKEAYAQTDCTATSTTACFDASVKQGPSPLATQLVWSVPGASSCTAGGGGTAWTGSVPTSGTRNLSGITIDMSLTLACTGPGKATLSWTHDGKNNDGSTATLAGFTVLYGATPSALVSTVQINNPALRTYDVTQLAAGNWSFAVRARATNGAESINSNVTTLAVVGSKFNASVLIDVTALPNPPVLSVTETTAMEIRATRSGRLQASRVGLVPLGTRCYQDTRTVARVTYNGVPVEMVDFVNWPAETNLREAWAKCGA